jgi:hypothetical protein
MRRSAAFIVGIALPTILWKLGGHLLSADILPCTVEELIRCFWPSLFRQSSILIDS